MANIILSVLVQKYTLIFILSLLSATQIFFAIRECIRKPKKENFYLLSVRLMNAAEKCTTFDELDAVKNDFFHSFKKYSGHEDFKDCYSEVNNAIRYKTHQLHSKNFAECLQ